MRRPELTVLIPVYNEESTLAAVLDAVSATAFDKQVVVIDDGSTDATARVLAGWLSRRAEQGLDHDVEVVWHPVNRGKGAAIRSGLQRARGVVALVQDADLEYDPADYPALVAPILRDEADAVYGSRYLRPGTRLPWTINRVCVVLLNALVRGLYGQRLTDEATCYKAFRTDVLRRMNLVCTRFEFCPEVTAKACRMGMRLLEVPAQYRPRTVQQGKKIRWRDGVEAVLTLLRWRIVPFRPLPADATELPEDATSRADSPATSKEAAALVATSPGRA